MLRTFAVAVVLAALLWPGSRSSPGSGITEQDLRIFSAGRLYTIATHVTRPAGLGPFPAVILNHGTGATARERREESPELLRNAALEFARRGYVVLQPLRAGFGATGGPLGEYVGSCEAPNYLRGTAHGAEDVLAVYAYARRLPYVDGSRMILAGQSAGGVIALAAAARKPAGLAAVLAFAAGMGGDPQAHPGQACAPQAMAALFEDLGRHVRAPVLLNYAANDRWFGTASHVWFEKLRGAGASTEYVLLPPFGADGHFVFAAAAGAASWVPRVAAFLERHGLPFALPKRAARA
jgi:dienelactone hydrolase